jgi:thimet oligopeptidase
LRTACGLFEPHAPFPLDFLLATLLAAAIPVAHAGDLAADIDAHLAKASLTPASAEAVEARCDASLALIARGRGALEARNERASLDVDFAAYDALAVLIDDSGNEMQLLGQVHPQDAVRDAAQACQEDLADADIGVSLSRPIYDRLAAIPVAGLDEATAYTLAKVLVGFRLNGVDKDAATRVKLAALKRTITEQGLDFAKNIRDDRGDIALDPAELAGLPPDFIAAHPPGADGKVHLTFDYPDVYPVLEFGRVREARRKVFLGFANRAWPANEAVLKELLTARYELARKLGYPDYATLATADKMVGTPQHARDFIDEVAAAAQPAADADKAELAAFARQEDPSIDVLQRYDASYFENRLRKERFDVDATQVRRYFTYGRTRDGLFALMRQLFGADIRPWDTPVWAPDVTAWECWDGDRLVGRFYLDMHPREGKFNHAAQFPIRTGVAGRQLPVGALVANFPATGPLEHEDVSVFLHELGHLVHSLYSGHVRYGLQSMGDVQWDFIEAPSQLLEEWTWDYATLKTFAIDDAGQPIPEDLVRRMNAARRFAQAGKWKGQLAYAAVSLALHDRRPDFAIGPLVDQQIARYSMYPVVPGAHQYASFGHLDGYSAIYYTYAWSKAIALDLFTCFAGRMHDRDVAMRYRRLVLEPGGSKDANALIHDFLGRERRMDAFRAWLRKDAEGQPALDVPPGCACTEK